MYPLIMSVYEMLIKIWNENCQVGPSDIYHNYILSNTKPLW